jgi:hypothetical protein
VDFSFLAKGAADSDPDHDVHAGLNDDRLPTIAQEEIPLSPRSVLLPLSPRSVLLPQSPSSPSNYAPDDHVGLKIWGIEPTSDHHR